jgi:hypothetical protein
MIMGIFDMFDQALADDLGVDVETYINTIDKFDDEDMEYIIGTLLNEKTSVEEKEKARDLFNTKLK